MSLFGFGFGSSDRTTLNSVLTFVKTLTSEVRTVMAEIDDLKAAVAAAIQAISNEQAQVSQTVTDMDQAVTKLMTVVGTGILPADVETAATTLQAQIAALATNTANLKTHSDSLAAQLAKP